MKRIEALKPLSRDHHFGLLLCWKIRQGIKNKVDEERIKRYSDWCWENYLKHHFEIEETHLFPLLGLDHPLIKQAIAEHKRIKRLFEQKEQILNSLSLLEEELEKHIRMEERVLFSEIQQTVSLEKINKVHELDVPLPVENWNDEFWKS